MSVRPQTKDKPAAAAFQWDDPFLLDEQLTEDERMIRDTARAYAQDKLQPRIVKDLFTGQARMQVVLQHFKKAGRGVLVYLRDGAAGVPVEPVGEPKTAEADRNRQWREVGVGAQILRDLGVTSIINLTSSVHDYKGLSGFGIEIVSNERLDT